MRCKNAIAGLCLISLLVCPLPAHARFGEFSLKDEMEYGRQFEVLVKSMMPLVEDPEVKHYVQGVVDSITATLPPQPYKFNTSVILHPSMNAFATPGGFIFVFTGLVQNLEHESQLAGVLSHEIAHVTQRHIASRIERGQIISVASLLVAIAGMVAGGENVGSAAVAGSSAAAQAAMLNYSRADESDADQFGLQYLIAAGYNPRGLGGAFSKIQDMNWSRGSNFAEYLSTHPEITTRLTTLNSRLQSMSSDLLNRPEKDEKFIRVQTLIWARYGDAQHAAQVFAARDQKNAVTHMGKGILAARQNQVREADAAFKEALRLAPEDPLILREAGTFHYNKGDIKQARQQLEKALRLDPDDYMGRFFYARLLDDLGDSVAAQDHYRRVLRFVPEDAEVHTYYGRSLGNSQQLFRGYLHLAYAALYSNDKRRVENWLSKAKACAVNAQEKADLERFEERFQERKKVWDSA